MAASYPTSIKSFSTKTAGQTVASAHINDLQDEVVAVETDLVARAALVPVLFDFRLSLTTAVPVTTADVTAATTLRLVPYTGPRCTVFDSSGNPTVLTSGEISIAVPATTSQMYDVFVYNSSGSLTLELLAWTNDTTPATAIVRTGGLSAAGVYTKSGDTTRRYVGSFRTTTVSGQTEDSLTKRYVWNYYNRVNRYLLRLESTASWSYGTTSIRQANASTSNQVDMVIGVSEDPVHVSIHAAGSASAPGFQFRVDMGLDGVAAATANAQAGLVYATGADYRIQIIVNYDGYPGRGRHYLTWLETGGGGTQTWYGSGVAAGLSGWVKG